ncbi:MAG TPA: DUF2177 family protein [Burkholderiaceae bacterium]|nr:DUF2177 family protein [Burkholderiaceae bacterium]
MTPRRFALAWLATLLVFLPIDAVWLTLAGPRLYTPALGHLLAPQPDLVAAAVFYVLYLAGLVVFTVRPDDLAEPWPRSAARAAFFGLVAYATYDLTNQATVKDWPWHITAIDLVWGAVLTAGATLGARGLLKRLGAR